MPNWVLFKENRISCAFLGMVSWKCFGCRQRGSGGSLWVAGGFLRLFCVGFEQGRQWEAAAVAAALVAVVVVVVVVVVAVVVVVVAVGVIVPVVVVVVVAVVVVAVNTAPRGQDNLTC